MDESLLYERYQRQIRLKEFGLDAQLLLLRKRVLVIGAGGLGCPVLQYLAAAGIGTIGIADYDTVALHNLHRQPLYTVNDVGQPKADCAARFLQALNPAITVQIFKERLSSANAWEIIDDFDVVVDGSDNFATRYLVNDACVLQEKPLVYGAISQWEGQVAVFNAMMQHGRSLNYRDLFPTPPKEDEVLNCAEAGVIGVLPGIIGCYMANEVIKLLTGIGTCFINKLFIFNSKDSSSYELELFPRNTQITEMPSDRAAFEKMDYDWLCATEQNQLEINGNDFEALLNTPSVLVIDLRHPSEQPRVSAFPHQQISPEILPVTEFPEQVDTIVLFCQSGQRSLLAAKRWQASGHHPKKVYSLKGGILNWINEKNT